MTNEHKGVMDERTFRYTAETLAIKCGIRADLNGYKCLTDAIILYGTGLCTEMGEIYRVTGQYRELQPKTVMREIGYAIKQSYGLSERLSKMLGVEIRRTEIHNALLIAYLGALFRDPASTFAARR